MTPTLSYKMHFASSPNCPFCEEIGTLSHMFLYYRELDPLKAHLQFLLHCIDSSLLLNDSLFITYFDPIKNNLPKTSKVLIDYILTLAKSCIYKTYFAVLKTVSDTTLSPSRSLDYLSVFQNALKRKIDNEKKFTVYSSFLERWGPFLGAVKGLQVESGALQET